MRKTNHATGSVLMLVLMGILGAFLVFIPASPASAANYGYDDLPLACGLVAPYASTYDSTTVNGNTYYHGNAIDIPMPSGSRVVAPVSGKAFVGYIY